MLAGWMVLGGAGRGVRAEDSAFTPGPYWFLDGGLIAELAGLARVIRPAERLPGPVVTGEVYG